MGACLFCDLACGAIPAERVYDDELCFAVNDIAPQAPLHVLFLPKEHFKSADEVNAARERLVGHLVHAAALFARSRGLDVSGYRLVFNHGAAAGQTVHHLHLHLLGGRVLGAMA